MKKLTLFAFKPHISNRDLGIVAAIQACALIPQLRLVAYVLIVVFIARMIPIRGNLFTRLGLAFGLATAAIGFIALAAWFLDMPLTALVVLSLINLLLLSLALSIRAPAHALRTNAHDLTAFLVGLATILFVMWPLLQNPEGQTLAKIIATGGDNMAHLEMMKASDLNQGVAYGLQNRVNPIANAVNYPQNWHFNLAFTKWLTEPLVDYTKSPSSILLLFYSFSALWLALLMLFIARISLLIIDHLPVQKVTFGLIGTVAVCTAVFLQWLVPLFTFGFQAQIAASVLLLLELFLVIFAFRAKPNQRYIPLLLATIIFVSLNSTWTFLSPLAAVLLATAVITTLLQTKSLGPRYFLLGITALGLLGILQPLFYKLFPVEYEFPTLLQRGYVQETDLFGLIFIFLIAVLYMIFRWKNKQLRTVFFLSCCALLFSLLLLSYHLSALGELRYFYYKATYAFIIIISPILAAIAYELIAVLMRQRSYLRRPVHLAVVCILVLTTTGMFCWQMRTKEVDSLILGKSAGIDDRQADYVLGTLANDPLKGYHSVFIGSCNRGDDIRATQMLHALAFLDSAPYSRVIFDPGKHEETEVFQSIIKAAQAADRPVTVFSGDQVLTAKLISYTGDTQSKVEIVQMDGTPETEPIKQCPDRIRDLTQFPN